MASIDQERKRISAAVVLYGAPGAGKTTALYALARQLPDGTHGKVAPLNAGDGRLLRLDYRPHDQELVYGFQVNFRLVACPGSIEVDLIRPLLASIDAVIFVADSSRTALKANVKALELLDRMLKPTGRQLADLPIVFLYNKRDLRDAVEIRLLEEKLNRFGCNYVAASAVRGQGVLDALQRLTASVAVQVRQQVQSSAGEGGAVPATVAHGTTIQQARALHAPASGNDDQTAVPTQGQQPGVRWDGDDDRTELNPGGSEPAPPTDWTADPGDFTSPSLPDQGGHAHGSGDLTAPSDDHTASGGDWTRPSPGQRPSPAAAFASGASVSNSFRELTLLEPEMPAPSVPAGTWRTPAALAEDIDADDHTMPFREPEEFDQGSPSPDDITETGYVASKPAPAARPARIASSPAPRSPAMPMAKRPPRVAAAAAPSPGPQMGAATARRVERPRVVSAPAPAAPATPAIAPVSGAQAVSPVESPGAVDFTATQVINSLGRQPEAWESSIESSAHRMKIPVPDLAGYVVSRIGTPKASTRRTIQIPVRATHMDTLMPQDFMLGLDFRGTGGRAPSMSARKRPVESDSKSVPMSWFVGLFGLSIVVIVGLAVMLLGQG